MQKYAIIASACHLISKFRQFYRKNLEFFSSRKGWIIDCRIKFDAKSEEKEKSWNCQSPAHLLYIVPGSILSFPEKNLSLPFNFVLFLSKRWPNVCLVFNQRQCEFFLNFFCRRFFRFQIESMKEKFNVKVFADCKLSIQALEVSILYKGAPEVKGRYLLSKNNKVSLESLLSNEIYIAPAFLLIKISLLVDRDTKKLRFRLGRRSGV